GITFQLQCGPGKMMEDYMCLGNPFYNCFEYISFFGLYFKDENNNLNETRTDEVLKIILSQ
ncbi:hypothetical protein BgiMline_006618, partial [Biomphalaria glabrata]